MKDLLTKFAANNVGVHIDKFLIDNEADAGNKLNTGIKDIINVVIGALAIVCVVVIIIGGINYMTSSGDATKVKKAKDTILYGIVGMIICALAFAIVNWVIGTLLGQS